MLLVNGCNVCLADTAQSAILLDHAWVLGSGAISGLHGPIVENLASLVEFEGRTCIAEMLRVWAELVRFWSKTVACRRSSFHNGCLVWLASMETITSWAGSGLHDLIAAVVGGPPHWIDLDDLLLGRMLVAKAGRATGNLPVAIQHKRVLPVNLAVNVTWLLKVVGYRQVTKNSLASVGGGTDRILHLLLILRAGSEIAMVLLVVAIGQWFHNLLIVRVVDGWVLLDFVLDTIHARFTNGWRTVLLCFVVLWKWLDIAWGFLVHVVLVTQWRARGTSIPYIVATVQHMLVDRASCRVYRIETLVAICRCLRFFVCLAWAECSA